MSASTSWLGSARNKIILAVCIIAIILLGIFTPLLRFFFGAILPYIAIFTFVIGVVYRIVLWAKSPVPFHIPTSCGQQKSLPWISSSYLDNPHNTLGVVCRMALEVLCFRSLFKNTSTKLIEGPRIVYCTNILLWLAGLAFHWCFLIIVIRHIRFFTDPIPSFVLLLEYLDGFLQIGVPALYISNILLIGALIFLFMRRVIHPKLRYISLLADYFPLLLILLIALTGVLMRYTVLKPDIVGVKELSMGLATFHPSVPAGIGYVFYIHLFLVCVLISYFPFSKLMHMAGVFLSPTRNQPNNSRMVRHVNPWNYPVKVHTYEEWEDDFRDKMKAAGYPLEKE